MHAMVSDPGARTEQGHLSAAHIDFRLSKSVVHPNVQYFGALSLQPCGLRVRALRLTACMLAVLRLKAKITPRPPRTRYPAAANLTGAGFPPARLHDLARPHWTFLSEAEHSPAWEMSLNVWAAIDFQSDVSGVRGSRTD